MLRKMMSNSSKWMPWELGCFDGLKSGNVSILPVLDRANQSFRGQEYLGLYPVVYKGKYTSGVEEVFVKKATGGAGWKTVESFGK